MKNRIIRRPFGIVLRYLAFGLLTAVVCLLPLLLDKNLPGILPVARILLNLLPMGLLALLFLALTRRPFAASVCLFFMAGFTYFASDIKLAHLDEPLVFADFFLAPQVVTGFNVMKLYISTGYVVVALLAFVLLLVAAFKWEKPVFGWPSGLVLGVLVCALIVGLGNKNHLPGSLYHSGWMVSSDWEATRNVRENGLFATLARASSRVIFDFPDVDATAIRRPDFLPDPAVEDVLQTRQLPDIIVVLSESFFDLGILKGVEDCEYLPVYCMVRSQGQSGWIEVPSYGGFTTRSEFELLTSIPVSLFPDFRYPYMSVVNRPVAALPWYLRSLGYQTTVIHTNNSTFWRRHHVMPRLGFDEFIALEQMEDPLRHGYFVADSVLTREMTKFLDQNGQGPPQFLFAISMENHGSWSASRLSVLPESVLDIMVPDAVKDQPEHQLQQYLYHAEFVVEELRNLQEYVQQRERETLLLFFGDHLPALGDTFDALGFDNELGPLKQFPPFLLLSNFSLDYQLPRQLGIHQLLLQALYAAGLPLRGEYAEMRQAYNYLLESDSEQEQLELDEYLFQLQALLLQRREVQ